MTTPEEPARPPLVVVRGEANEEEVAALTAVVAAIAGQASVPPPSPRPRSQWASRARQVRSPHVAGPDGWRASGLPR